MTFFGGKSPKWAQDGEWLTFFGGKLPKWAQDGEWLAFFGGKYNRRPIRFIRIPE